jgi:molybdopterin-guanine dinucleotide biosynthesis protein A
VCFSAPRRQEEIMPVANSDTRQIKTPISDVTGVILAGGKSRRYGTNKAFVEINGTQLIDKVASVMRAIFKRVILITNCPREYSYLHLPAHEDLIQGLGPIGGIYTGLETIQDDAGFFIACDMPFASQDLIRYIVSVSVKGKFDAIVPKVDWKMEPLHALYRKSCLPVLMELIASGSYQILESFHRLNVRFIDETEITTYDPQLRSFFNVNRPDELPDKLNKAGKG